MLNGIEKLLVIMAILSLPLMFHFAFASNVIPPTKSIIMINGTDGNVTAVNWKGYVELIEGAGISYDFDYANNAITISSGAGSASLEQLTNVTDDFCTTGQVRTASGNQWVCTTLTTYASQLNDLSDVTIAGVAYNHILQYSAALGQWINKLFSINTQVPANDVFITGINNQTGVITTNQFSVNTVTSPAVDFQVWDINNVTGQVKTNQFSVNTLTCGGTDKISSINNVTGQVICTTDSTGASIALNDLTDVTITSVAYNHILQYSTAVSQWINKLFTINTLSPTTDVFVTGINNQTGVITTNQFSVNTVTSPAVDFQVWDINNVTGQVKTNQFSVNTQSAAVDQQIIGINNVTGQITRNTFSVNTVTAGVGDTFVNSIDNATGNVNLKQFSVNSVTSPAVDFQVYDINNVTGQVKTNQFSVNTLTCGGTDKISSINNVTGQVICTTDSTGAGGSGIPLPPKKWGDLQPRSTTGFLGGLMLGCTIDATATYVYDTTDPSNAILSTTAITDGVNGGVHCKGTNFDSFRGDQNAYMYAKWEENKITTNRIFIGFSNTATFLPNNADTTLDAISGAGLCIRTTDTVYQFCHNDGTGAMVVQSLTTTEDLLSHRFEVYTTDSGVTWCGKLDGGTAVCSSTAADLPAVTTRLFAESSGETDGGATAILWTQYGMYVQSDK